MKKDIEMFLGKFADFDAYGEISLFIQGEDVKVSDTVSIDEINADSEWFTVEYGNLGISVDIKESEVFTDENLHEFRIITPRTEITMSV